VHANVQCSSARICAMQQCYRNAAPAQHPELLHATQHRKVVCRPSKLSPLLLAAAERAPHAIWQTLSPVLLARLARKTHLGLLLAKNQQPSASLAQAATGPCLAAMQLSCHALQPSQHTSSDTALLPDL
jgi:hypothetical protein